MNIDYNRFEVDFKDGSVILAGCGPGNIQLITLKVFSVLKQADVIIYDALVNKSLLKICKKNAKLIFAGKLKNKKACSQNDINKWLVSYAKKRLKVLRLKSGDPSFFSRGSEEITSLKKNKIDFRVFSGITASQPSIKDVNGSFFNESGFCNFITGHKRINNPNQDIDYKSIAKNKGKIIIYMGISQIVDISKNLINSGIDQNRKVSIIYNASLPSQRIFFSKLHNAPEIIKKNKVSPPAIIIID